MRAAGLLVLACALACGQSFDAASVKPAPVPPQGGVYFGPPRGGPGTEDPQQITWSYALMKRMLLRAYGVANDQIEGPAWIDQERYEIVAKVPAGATEQQLPALWQNLLAERFGLKLHRIRKEFRVKELSIAEGGPKLKQTAAEEATALPLAGPPQIKQGALLTTGRLMISIRRPSGINGRIMAKAQTMAELAAMLSNLAERPVLDRTGLAGKYDYSVEYRIGDLNLLPGAPPDPSPQPGGPGESAPDLARALEQQLGLRLTDGKAMLDVLVIDHLDKTPAPN